MESLKGKQHIRQHFVSVLDDPPLHDSIYTVQAEDFARELSKIQANAATELLGRAPVDAVQAERGVNAAAAADRILSAMLSVPDREQRLAMLPEAFTAPTAAAQVSPAPHVRRSP